MKVIKVSAAAAEALMVLYRVGEREILGNWFVFYSGKKKCKKKKKKIRNKATNKT